MRHCLPLLLFACLTSQHAFALSTVTYFGGAGKVGGSSVLVSNGSVRLLVDCGAAYENESSPEPTNGVSPFAFDPTGIACVLLTHAHQDHSGRIPELVASGFAGEIWMTPPTREILTILWRSQFNYETEIPRNWVWSSQKDRRRRTVHWHADCEWQKKIAQRNRRTFSGTRAALQKLLKREYGAKAYATSCQRCIDCEMQSIMQRVRTVPFDTCATNGPFEITFRPVKHLPGAAAVYFDDGDATWAFSGDLGSTRSRLVDTIPPAARVDNLFIEATYGDDARCDKRETDAEYKRFRKAVGQVVQSGGIAWIPAFALDRSQRVLAEIAAGMDEGVIDKNVPLYYPSQTSRAYTRKYLEHPEWFDNDVMARARPLFERSREQFSPDAHTGSAILLTTSAMMDAGLSLALIPDLLPRRDVTLFQTGYQSPTSYGGRIKHGEKTLHVSVKGRLRPVSVNCNIEQVRVFSGHADARDADAWLSKNKKAHIFLVHGDKSALEARKKGLETRYHATVDIVEPGITYVMKSKKEEGRRKKEEVRKEEVRK